MQRGATGLLVVLRPSAHRGGASAAASASSASSSSSAAVAAAWAVGARGQPQQRHIYMQRRGLVVLQRRRPRGGLSSGPASSAGRPPLPSGHAWLESASSSGSSGGGGAGALRIAQRALSSGPQQVVHPAEAAPEEEEEVAGKHAAGRPNHKSKITAAHIVRQRQRKVCQLNADATLEEAIRMLASNNSSSCMVYDDKKKGKEGQKEVVGIFSSRDIIKKLSKNRNTLEALASPIKEVMTPISRMIHCSPDETLEKVQYIMVELKIRALPVVKDGVIYGIITLGDVINHHYSSEEIGGKKAFIKGVTGRLGLPTGARIASHVVKEGVKKSIRFKVGHSELPHPFKRPDGCAMNQREHGAGEYAMDPALSEDASFVTRLPWLHENGDEVTYIGIADGVGSWREHGVDPRQYSHRLMELAEEFVKSMAPKAPNLMTPIVRPLDVLSAAWEAIAKEQVVGSCTACVATLDNELNQLSFCNVGDNGILIMRHIDSDVAGYMRDKTTPRPLRTNDFRIAFVSRQQLRSFNLPYQLGYTNTAEGGDATSHFDTPSDADNSSIPVMRGDVIIMATDGLFDNVELDEICSIALEWEKRWFSSGAHSGGLLAQGFPDESVQELADTLCRRARELSLDQKRDSPFAILAKENDIMWGGGMPDDCTVVAIRVVKDGANGNGNGSGGAAGGGGGGGGGGQK